MNSFETDLRIDNHAPWCCVKLQGNETLFIGIYAENGKIIDQLKYLNQKQVEQLTEYLNVIKNFMKK